MEGLGVDLKYLIIQIANIGIFYFLFTKFLLKPILKLLDERKAKIQEGLENAEKAKQELVKVEETKEEAKKKTKLEEKKLLEETKRQAEKEALVIMANAKQQSAKIVKDAGISAKQIEAQAVSDAKKKTLEMVEAIAERVISEKLSNPEIKARFQSAMNQLYS
jgi:F-type H+-transporting ATPase subunit b